VLADRDFSYGINVTIVGITSYAILFAILPIVTPVIEALGKDVTSMVWMTAVERSPPKRRTLFPFPVDLFERRKAKEDVEGGGAGATAAGSSSTLSLKGSVGKGKEKVKTEKIGFQY
jgi:hypothetical protein